MSINYFLQHLFRVIAVLIAVAVVSSSSYSEDRGPESLTAEKLNELLEGSIHGIPWNAYIGDGTNTPQIRKLLVSYIQVKLQNNDLDVAAARAIQELGNFALENNGTISADVKTIYDKLVSHRSLDEDLKTDLIWSYGNANNIEAVRSVLSEVDSSDQAIQAVALQTLEKMLQPALEGANENTDSEKLYRPNLGIPLSKRARAAEWKQVIREIQKKLTRLLDKESSPDIQALIKRAIQAAKALLASETNGAGGANIEIITSTSITTSLTSSSPTPAVDTKTNDTLTSGDNKSSSTVRWEFLAGLVTISLVVLTFLLRKKRADRRNNQSH